VLRVEEIHRFLISDLSVLHFQSQWTMCLTYFNAALVILMCVSGMVWTFSFTMVIYTRTASHIV
jgi:hypothetical protein